MYSSFVTCRNVILKSVGTGYGAYAFSVSGINLITTTVVTGTGTGIVVLQNAIALRTTVNNQATTPLNPASGQSTPATYPWNYSYIL
jgi:hypothetical protein